MNRLCKNLNSVQTEILTWGEPFVDRKQDIIVCITGNPGVSDFYIDFASELYKNVRLPLCVIGHAGHDYNSSNKTYQLVNNEHLFNLDAQVKHKLDFIENYIHPNSKIHLIGHSIGAWIIVECLHKNDHLMDRVLSINLLFPTLQRMAESKNGKYITNFLRKMHWFVLFLCNFLYLFPTFAIGLIINLYLTIKSLPYNLCDAILKMVNPSVVEKILFMAYDEMDTVKKLNEEGIDKIKHLTNVIYGKRDNWAPLEYMDDLKKYKPSIKMTEAHDVEHAFVLRSSEFVADMVANFIKLKVNG
ncbi:unnamed protein product [Euphydryas editha]|uniref:Lipid droplet-associated hydrolase n=1 Tax=Euphydryas editha TaxID=104508 RepID=A0AAU9US53_EUPED|nr:unnamed protein product [Euphydryas editha]